MNSCEGCVSLIIIGDDEDKKLCIFTISRPHTHAHNSFILPNCTCQSCLIKTVCGEICEEFRQILRANKHRRITHERNHKELHNADSW